ncbi:MAG: DEAD/DEAH box helicase [Anaerolineales bacterium]
MPSLANDIRQLFAQAALSNFERLDEADIQFTFSSADVYLSSFSGALERVETSGFLEHDKELLTFAQVFERYLTHPTEIVNPAHAALASSSFYWLSGYTASALVIAKAIRQSDPDVGQVSDLLLRILARDRITEPQKGDHPIYKNFFDYAIAGNREAIERAIGDSRELAESTLAELDVDQHIAAYLLSRVLIRLQFTGFWEAIRTNSTAPRDIWERFLRLQTDTGNPMVDLWPSQRIAIARGLLDGVSSLVLRMPTSSGKTRMTELAFVNDLFTHADRKCLYLAPYRALVGEVEREIGSTLSALGIPVTSLYGGAEANELEVQLSEIARVIIATPEKIQAVHRLSGDSLGDFGTIVLDEGHLIDDISRGASYELQLSSLKEDLAKAGRVIFISAVLPNAAEIASWLAGSSETLAEDTWQPTTMRIGVVTWPKNQPSSLRYLVQTGQPVTDGFFVPRLIEEEVWEEVNPPTNRMRTIKFPRRDDKGSISAALGFQFARNGPVIVFTGRPDWANSVARKIVERSGLQRPMAFSLVDEDNKDALQLLSEYMKQVVGEESILPEAVLLGVGLHHGGIPQSLRLVIEDEYRRGNIRLLIATNTIAQGINFPAKTIIVHSFPQTQSPVRDFWNLAGRAGRALRETEGEIIILDTGVPKPRRVRRFIDAGHAEPAESQILYLLTRLLDEYPEVSEEALSQLLEDEEDGVRFARTIQAIDSHLLEIMAEDVALEAEDDDFRSLFENLFATHQAESHDLEYGTVYREALEELLVQRRSSVLRRVPEGSRKRYARSSISINSAILIDQSAEQFVADLSNLPALTEDSLLHVLELVTQTAELEGRDPLEMSLLADRWITTGSYDEVFRAIEDKFRTYDQAVTYVERELSYRLSWVVNGLLRLLETTDEFALARDQGGIPQWLELLPQFLRYGAASKEMVWAMSLGIADRTYGSWILQRFADEQARGPNSFRELISWVLDRPEELVQLSLQEWPKYFAIALQGIIDRYSGLRDMLAA